MVYRSLLRSTFLSPCLFLNMCLLQLSYQVKMSLELTINSDFLQMLDPPASYPPNEEELAIQIENKFLSECERFISNEKMLYKCSKSIENKLKSILSTSQNIKQNLSAQKQKFQAINTELQKYKDQREILREREKILKMLCDLIKMEEMRKDLLLVDNEKKQMSESRKMEPVNEEQYLSKLQKLSKIMQESAALAEFKEQFSLINDITVELETIFSQALQYLIKELMTPRMVQLSLGRFCHIFFTESKQNGLFLQAIIRNRVQFMKISLNPMINSLNYASNIPELYESILTSWIALLRQETVLFDYSKQHQIMRAAHQQLMGQLIPKMEKNIFRIKELVQVVRIRKYFYQFMKDLDQIEQLKYKQKSEEKQELILGLLSKCEAIIESQLASESQSLQNSKYNIYTLASYIPIRQHLQKLKVCFEFSLEEEKMDWEVAFYSLFSSRDPKNYPNNKSLIIFNLNIWYLYLKLIPQGKHRKEGEELMNWCKNAFTSINVNETNKKYYPSFDKVLEMGGNFTAFKNTLLSEIQLLGHEELRKELTFAVTERYLQGYQALLSKIDKKPMTNEEVKQFCSSKKINLNKFGKFSQTVCIFSQQQLRQLLQE